MIIILTIFQYLVQATVDLMDKFLITARKIEPVSYTFFTVVTGLLLLLIWPWTFFLLPAKFIFLDLFSGAFFSLAMYVFFVALSQGEVSRVVPYVFGLVPVFDILLGLLTGRNILSLNEIGAMFLLVPGALLVSHQSGNFWGKHVALKTLSAFLFSSYYALWQYGSQIGPVLNNLMWNRLGAAGVLLALLFLPVFRKKAFATEKVKSKASTSFLFLFKQVLGGANFIFLSFLLVLGKIAIINGLQGFRYVFLLLFSLLLTKRRSHLILEQSDRDVIWQKGFGIGLVFLGTLLLFVK
jgi:uncharacterized membrane protein